MKLTLTATTGAVAVALALTGCTGGDVEVTASSTSAPSSSASSFPSDTGTTTESSPSGTSSEASSPSSITSTPSPTVTPSKQADGTVERLTDKGGVVTKGSMVTFVYNNGLRYPVDAGREVPATGPVDMTTPKGRLVVREDGSASFTALGARHVVTVSAAGSGAMVDKDGLVTVLDNGSTACASGQGLNLVNTDGSKAQATPSGVIVLGKDGKSTRYAAPGAEGKPVGSFNQCGPTNTVQVDLTADVLFEYAESNLTTAGKQVVASAAKIINANGKGKKVMIVGHTDSTGTPEGNQKLGLARAHSVEKELKRLCPGTTFEASSKGQTEPVAANRKPDGSDNPEGRAKNRRVTISWEK